MTQLSEFQQAAVRRIVERLSDSSGSRRFLLADEVGLGKTLIARGVVEELAERRRKGQAYTVVYICSNAEIAEQNCTKLVKEASEAQTFKQRLTLLSLSSEELERAREASALQLFSFTPGTSLQVGAATGQCLERQLLYFLVHKLLRNPASAKWRDFFRCGVSRSRWSDEWTPQLRARFRKRISQDYQDRLAKSLQTWRLQLVDADSGEQLAHRSLLTDALERCVDEYSQYEGQYVRKNQRLVIGALRHVLAAVSLDFLEPDLVILDEFQRFREILRHADEAHTVESKLFAKKRVRVLILSATPYKMYTLSHEEEDHHADFLRTYRFLARCDEDSDQIRELQRRLAFFRTRLYQLDTSGEIDEQLYETKVAVEQQLKLVMCRTERSRYIEDLRKGIEEVPAQGVVEGTLPQREELLEYIRLRQFLLKNKSRASEYGANVMDFWKSGPSILTFMDSNYALIRGLRTQAEKLPKELLRPAADIPNASRSNLKCRMLHEKVFGDDALVGTASGSTAGPDWKYLWTRPSYFYYEDKFFKDDDPGKYLVFSHWRFVPKTIAYLTSKEAERRLGRPDKFRDLTPLKYGDKVSLYTFDVCYPSLALAALINPLQLVESEPAKTGRRELVARATKLLTRKLRKLGVEIGPGRQRWNVVARLEATLSCSEEIAAAIWHSRVAGRESGRSDAYDAVAEAYHNKLTTQSEKLRLSSKEVGRLAVIGLFSPAVAILRALLTEYVDLADEGAVQRFISMPQDPGRVDSKAQPTLLCRVINLCVNQLRNFFNRDLVQAVVRRHGSGNTYTSRVLSYCSKAHFQATVDEYVYLLRNVLQTENPHTLVSHLGRVLGMYSGSPNINLRSTHGTLASSKQSMAAHFALAFGDDAATQDEDGVQQKSRQSHVREAFNSPFWPFVLATTSVGQEGLDFHLYCGDIIHWNLPSNPIDLEQREGRLNRFDCVTVRHNIAGDYPLAELLKTTHGRTGHVWKWIFEEIMRTPRGGQQHRHGLFPHWLYQPQQCDERLLRRHLLFYSQSDDIEHYRRLKHELALYRLVFGQPRQQDIVARIRERLSNGSAEIDMQALTRLLPAYMINLSPFDEQYARQSATTEALHLLHDPAGRQRLLDDVQRIFAANQSSLQSVAREFAELKRIVEQPDGQSPGDTASLMTALAALAYLRNPFDAVYDFFAHVGFKDDILFLREAYQEISGNPAIDLSAAMRMSGGTSMADVIDHLT
jgi:uncharacterized membrane protein YkvA (DUF1232 family)